MIKISSNSKRNLDNFLKVLFQYRVFLLSIFIIIISFVTFFNNYSQPAALFWDENYHIASAEKYIEGVFFMEPHPPLGKQLIALGEVLFNPNAGIDKSEFVKTDKINEVPKGFSFVGFRFFPTLLAMFSPLLLFFIFYFISKRSLISFLFSFLYLFDNGLIVHSRSAMLEGPQLFFILAALAFLFFRISRNPSETRSTDSGNLKRIRNYNYFILGILGGLSLAVKVNSLIIFPIVILFFIKEFWGEKVLNRKIIFKIFIKGLIYTVAFVIPFIISYQIHYAIGWRVVNNNYYTASDGYKKIIDSHQTWNPIFGVTMINESLYYSAHYTQGVPALNICKPDENGSSPIGWPLGNKSINYRWEKLSNGDVRYLYLQGNPIVWNIVLIAAVLSAVLIVSKFVFGLPVKNKRLFYLIVFFTGLYFGYIGTTLTITRVLYLYHYFIALIFGMILAFLIYLYLSEELIKNKYRLVLFQLCIIAILIMITFLRFSPLTYYFPINTIDFTKLEWFQLWGLKPV